MLAGTGMSFGSNIEAKGSEGVIGECGQWNDAGQPSLAQSQTREERPEEEAQLPLFVEMSSVEEELRGMNIVEMTPLEALNKLKELQDRLLKKG